MTELVDVSQGLPTLRAAFAEAIQEGKHLHFRIEDGLMRVRVGDSGPWSDPVATEMPEPVNPEATGEVFYRETYGRRRRDS